MKTKVLVTGAKGQLAKSIKAKTDQLSKDIDFVFVSREQLDISEQKQVKEFFGLNAFDYCVNCAAYTNVELAETEIERSIAINATGVKNLAENCLEKHTVLIHISTDYVFDGKTSIPYTEKDPTNPLNQYGKSKLSGEKYIREILEKYFIIRTSWLYSEFGNNFAKTILNKLNNNQASNIISSELGTPTSCSDLAIFILYIIQNDIKNYGFYHFSAEGSTTWYGFAKHIANQFNKAHLVSEIKNYPMKAKRPKYSVLDNRKATSLLKQNFNWQDSVSKVISKLAQR